MFILYLYNMCDKLVFDLAQEVEGSPSVFIRKDWINCLDNQNQNYNNNQSILDTSQICNSNKYMSYREAYLSIPFLLTVGNVQSIASATGTTTIGGTLWNPNTSATSDDYSIGLKNWFGQIIHSFTLDYNGTTIIQQTPYINMWNSFKLMTSLSLDDINTQGATIGFYPDDPQSWSITASNTVGFNGNGTCNNTNAVQFPNLTTQFNVYKSAYGNEGFLNRQRLINLNMDAIVSGQAGALNYAGLLLNGAGACNQVWQSYIFNKVNQTGQTTATAGILQIAVQATVYLKHIHDFFNMTPLLKGVFMKMTMNLNNTTSTVAFNSVSGGTANNNLSPASMFCTSVQNPLGGVNPLMVASSASTTMGTGSAVCVQFNGSYNYYIDGAGNTNSSATAQPYTQLYRFNISVGSVCLDQTLRQNPNCLSGPLSKSIYLYIPAYTFNPPFEQAYLSTPVKTIKYSDIYQYQVVNIATGQNFNNLITNGIANIKSVLVLPFYSASTSGSTTVGPTTQTVSNSQNTGFLSGTPVWQSPFDPAGTGPTSPFCWLSNFNIQVSGQNAIYNTERYNFEQFNNQLYGYNAVNGGLTDGLTSGLIDQLSFCRTYNYYYVDVERMLPAEQQVPKSIQILGQNWSSAALDLYVFVEFGVEIKIDCLTGARV